MQEPTVWSGFDRNRRYQRCPTWQWKASHLWLTYDFPIDFFHRNFALPWLSWLGKFNGNLTGCGSSLVEWNPWFSLVVFQWIRAEKVGFAASPRFLTIVFESDDTDPRQDERVLVWDDQQVLGTQCWCVQRWVLSAWGTPANIFRDCALCVISNDVLSHTRKVEDKRPSCLRSQPCLHGSFKSLF